MTGNRLPPTAVGALEETVDFGLAHSLSSQSLEEAEDSWRNTEVEFSMFGTEDSLITLFYFKSLNRISNMSVFVDVSH